jgi:hypothetical protein
LSARATIARGGIVERMLRRSLVVLACVLSSPALAQAQSIEVSSALGGPMADAVRAVALQSDGSIVVGGTFASLSLGSTMIRALAGATDASQGIVLRLSPDGRRVLAATRVGPAVSDLALDASDRVYVAASSSGAVVLAADLSALVRAHAAGDVRRIDVGSDGTYAALVPSTPASAETTPGAGRVFVFGADGAALSMFDGHRNTLDLAVHSASQRVVLVGWRQDNAFDGARTFPVQIAYLRGVDLRGATQWTDYDWSTDRASPNFINRTTNNMADTRGYRVSVGRDGRMFAAFECAGGNHIFRYDPADVTRTVSIVGGDAFHTFSNTRSEHKTFFAAYDPATGRYLLGQQIVGRLMSGAGNTVRVSEGAITTDEAGRVLLTGAAASGLPLTETLPSTGTYSGGAYLLVMSADLRSRLLLTRVDPGGHGHGVDARDGRIVYGGNTSDDGREFFARDPLQPAVLGMKDGFFALARVGGGDGGVAGDSGAAPIDASAPVVPSQDSGASTGDGSVDAGFAQGANGCACTVGVGRTERIDARWAALFALALVRRRRAPRR